MTQHQLHRYFRVQVSQAPSLSAFAERHGLTKQQVSGMYTGDIPVSGKVLETLGFKRVVIETFVPLGETVTIPEGFSEVAVSRSGRIVGRNKAVQRRRVREAKS